MKYELRTKGEFDYGLVAIVGVIILMGLFVIYSASYQKYVLSGTNLSLRQLQSGIIGILIAAAVFRVGYQRIIDFGYYIFGINVVLLLLVLFVGDMRYGARRWIEIGSFAFQPSEFAKITFIFALAKYLGDIKDGIGSPKALIAPFAMALVPMLLIFKEPDLGTALVFVPVLFAMLFIAGARLKYLMILIGSGLACAPFLWFFLKEYQRNRLMVFINPNLDPLGAGYTIIQSKIAIGSGGIIGKGWLAGTQNQLNFLPEHHTDFIFSVVGEEWGFIGSAVLLFLFYKLVEKGLRIAETTSDIYGKTLAYGIITVFTMHIIVNIGMVCGLMPVVGIPLPFVSYGGSSLIMSIVSIGILESIKNKRKVF